MDPSATKPIYDNVQVLDQALSRAKEWLAKVREDGEATFDDTLLNGLLTGEAYIVATLPNLFPDGSGEFKQSMLTGKLTLDGKTQDEYYVWGHICLGDKGSPHYEQFTAWKTPDAAEIHNLPIEFRGKNLSPQFIHFGSMLEEKLQIFWKGYKASSPALREILLKTTITQQELEKWEEEMAEPDDSDEDK